MGKHDRGVSYPRQDRDLYPTPAWVVDELAHVIALHKKMVWEPACGRGDMVAALYRHGALVSGSDIAPRPRDTAPRGPFERLDFLKADTPYCDWIITNPPYGPRGELAERFIERSLTFKFAAVAMLLPVDFDSAKRRRRFFRDERRFALKLVLNKRIVWFKRKDGGAEAPKENHAWYIWGAEERKTPRPEIWWSKGE